MSKIESIAEEASRTLISADLLKRDLPSKPEVTDLSGWRSYINQPLPRQPDAQVGRRLFFHSKLAGCYKCHAMNGRGHKVGPDLTTIRNQSDVSVDWLIEHIVNPNAEMAPYYRPQQLLTVDGQVLVGLVIGQEGQKQAYVDNNGEQFLVDKNDIEERRELKTSIMPEGLLDPLTAIEIRDLIHYLIGNPSKTMPAK